MTPTQQHPLTQAQKVALKAKMDAEDKVKADAAARVKKDAADAKAAKAATKAKADADAAKADADAKAADDAAKAAKDAADAKVAADAKAADDAAKAARKPKGYMMAPGKSIQEGNRIFDGDHADPITAGDLSGGTEAFKAFIESKHIIRAD